MEFIIPIAVAIIIGLYILVTYNSLVGLKNNAVESFSAIDTVLQNRYDLIPNLVEVVKQYAKHESETLANVTEMRSKLLSGGQDGGKERFVEENMLQSGMKSIFAIAENYPDLKANANFLELQGEWSELENRLQGARRGYNASVKDLNNKKEMFPSSVIAGMMTLPEYSSFDAGESVRTEKIDAKSMFAK